MPEIDIAIGPVTSLPIGAPKMWKAPYLIIMEDYSSVKNKVSKKFVTLDKPEFTIGFVQVKGFFTNLSEEEVIKSFPGCLTSVDKDLILEVWLPAHKISYMRSLVFKQK